MSIWPLTAEPALSVGGVCLTEIAERFGTPAYVVDEEHVRVRCREYAKAMAPHEVAYAAKAFWCRAMARWIAEEGLSLDLCSEGELAVARAAGFPGERIALHGDGKTASELSAALDYGVGRIIVDSHSEVRQLAALTAAAPVRGRQKVLVRVTPGAADVAQRVLDQPTLELAGVRGQIGSQVATLDGFEAAARHLVAFTAGLGGLPELNLGGHSVPYQASEDGLDIAAFAERITSVVHQECAVHGIAVPRLTIESGRAIVGGAGVTLYRVLTVKHGARTVVVVDGAMTGNPGPVLNGSRYHVERAGLLPAAGTEPMVVVGRPGEAGDVPVRDACLPAGIRPGDLLAVPCTGAYDHAMASNLGWLTRPPVLAVRESRVWPLIRRETVEDMLRRDVG